MRIAVDPRLDSTMSPLRATVLTLSTRSRAVACQFKAGYFGGSYYGFRYAG